MEVDQTKTYGVKLSVISKMDSLDLENITEVIRGLGYKVTFIDNGNVICEKQEE